MTIFSRRGGFGLMVLANVVWLARPKSVVGDIEIFEFFGGFFMEPWILDISIRVPNADHITVRLFDILLRGALRDFQNFIARFQVHNKFDCE
jgi:hypothetical protein